MRIFTYAGGTTRQYAGCSNLEFAPSSWCSDCAKYSAGIRRREYAPQFKIDFSTQHMLNMMNWRNDASHLIPTGDEIVTHYVIASSILRDVVIHNNISVDAKMTVQVVGKVGDTAPANNLALATVDEQSDVAAKALGQGAGLCAQPCYYGGDDVVATVDIDMKVRGSTRLKVDGFFQDEGLILVLFDKDMSAGCVSIIPAIDDMSQDGGCGCPVVSCPTTYPPSETCFTSL
jgi:hypothetical protein